MTKHEDREPGEILDSIARAIADMRRETDALEAALGQALREVKRLNAFEQKGRKEKHSAKA